MFNQPLSGSWHSETIEILHCVVRYTDYLLPQCHKNVTKKLERSRRFLVMYIHGRGATFVLQYDYATVMSSCYRESTVVVTLLKSTHAHAAHRHPLAGSALLRTTPIQLVSTFG